MRSRSRHPQAGVRAEQHGGALTATSGALQSDHVLHLPAPVGEQRDVPFPVIMTLLPLVVAIVLWLLFTSPAILAFGILGPVMAFANYAEARRRLRADRAKAQASFAHELEACRQHARHLAKQDFTALMSAAPGARAVVAGEHAVPGGPLCLGYGSVRARIQVQGELRDLPESARAELEDALLHSDAPVLMDPTDVVITGSRPLVMAVGRALLVQRSGQAAEIGIGSGTAGAQLSRELAAVGAPCRGAEENASQKGLLLELGGARSSVSPAVRSASFALRLHVESASTASVEFSPGQRLTFHPALVTAEEMRACYLRRLPAAGGEGPSDRAWRGVNESTNEQARTTDPETRRRASLFAELGTIGTASFGIDLVGEGPHAVIGGTTGSGKSELLLTWVLALTAARSTREVQVLCFDFKGGATFDPITSLPHCVGIVTDLDEGEAQRAAVSLGSEVRERESALRAAGATHIGQLPGLARLIIVVDEFQALADIGSDLPAVIADISARGRSLGMHLILCAQQPATAVRGATLANCGVRICLRVIADADSTALIGTPSAARLPASSPGLALVAAGDRVTEVQMEQREHRVVTQLIAAATERESHLGYGPPPPAWLPDLPRQIAAAALGSAETGVAFGMIDDTRARRQPPACFDATSGALVVIGGPRTGKSGTLAALVEATRAAGRCHAERAMVLDSHPEGAWDQLFAGDLEACQGLLVIDDVDALLALVDEPHRTAMTDQLVRLIRRSASAAPAVIFSVSRVTGGTAPLLAAAAQTLRLVGGDRSGFIMAGGEASDHRADAPPGRAVWQGKSCQVARAARALQSAAPAAGSGPRASLLPDGEGDVLVVARQRASLRRILEARGFSCIDVTAWRAEQRREGGGEKRQTTARAVLGDVEGWQAEFGSLSRLSAEYPVLLSGLTTGEHRALIRGDPLAPLTVDASRSAVLRDPEGRMRRVRWSDPVAGHA